MGLLSSVCPSTQIPQTVILSVRLKQNPPSLLRENGAWHHLRKFRVLGPHLLDQGSCHWEESASKSCHQGFPGYPVVKKLAVQGTPVLVWKIPHAKGSSCLPQLLSHRQQLLKPMLRTHALRQEHGRPLQQLYDKSSLSPSACQRTQHSPYSPHALTRLTKDKNKY